MKKMLLVLLFSCMGAWNAHAVDTFEAGGGVGSVDLGGGSTWIAYAAGELPLGVDLAPSVKTSIVGRIGTSGTASYQTILGPVRSTLDFFVSGLFKAGYELTGDLTAYAMVGFSFGSATATVGGLSASNTDTSISWGLGVDYQIDDRLKVGVDYTAYWSDVKAIAANVLFKF